MAAVPPPAQALNDAIAAANPNVLAMLSERGLQISFPHSGILGQSAEAKGKAINATIGIALEEDGSPMRLGVIEELVKTSPAETFPYASSFGDAKLRGVWRDMVYQKNPSLAGKAMSNPVVACALTHSLSVCGYIFGDPGDVVISPDMYWGNYKLIFQNAYGMKIATYPTFVGGGFNVEGLRAALAAGPVGKKIVLLNFPNNPTGYTCTDTEATAIVKVLVEAAEAGNNIVALLDDAYFGLVFEDGVYMESLFAPLADAHERILAVKIDGATKEDYVWGFRVGFISYATKGSTPALFKALEDKTAGAVRGNISNAPMLSQSLLLKAYTHPDYAAQKQAKYELLKARAVKVKDILAAHPEYASAFEPLPFNSGYFMCVSLKGADPEKVRKTLLTDYSTGVIAASGVIRVAFSATPLNQLETLFANLYGAVQKVQAAG